ncbi:MAG: hypothetical protein DRN12_00285 [Thermoplasmata archaeon]|nr:MAG: hypothetical protein DRN12_00285 [Thermoplasmata archaeon]
MEWDGIEDIKRLLKEKIYRSKGEDTYRYHTIRCVSLSRWSLTRRSENKTYWYNEKSNRYLEIVFKRFGNAVKGKLADDLPSVIIADETTVSSERLCIYGFGMLLIQKQERYFNWEDHLESNKYRV